MDKKELERRIEGGAFAANNGRLLRTINILSGRDIKMRSLQYALPDVSKGELAESLYYLQEAGYLHARHAAYGADVDVAEADQDDTEVRLTAKGIQLLKGYAADPAVSI
ncbi:hypothetical protein [Ethanoligenens harbinense]|uniref:Uncharacterized protein n=1 Tax=Ethanoligenens harbinense (strain DSM 18485 / JCM 12961 / CGMCC 1.5033 / YUAN-3) TaxID=663278 RepID=E6U5Z7_ETHHY|nr:hypothetical protein [Ethanoligenens harbinense]ADU25676.1 hypothetical protein Ethha_0086 [Ethanoligenens harbinense YUAN-3]ADU26089.1 hypothetical protein Ethha_0504 [Ethanoligenens harbinense YUAN-3]AVQ94852.1 hypothetical protein CXQ68_00440 [Ethanoligenens harbinense YUAN-3]AVQ95232.1 hypothetical protein CXQ68_02615 [Ethanoligenens harbinense YUAN-3]AYF37543.1 hypothetical protein CXP51_00445 [Ethanoligenens harbinense]